MELIITKSARKFGYLIWAGKTEPEIRNLLGDRTNIEVSINGLSIGVKSIDWKYHRISIGYKFTRALPETAKYYLLTLKNNVLEVIAKNGD